VSSLPCKLLITAEMAVSRCCIVGGPGCAALVLLVLNPSEVELELAAAPACWLSAAGNMAVKRRCLVFGPGCAALVSSSWERAGGRTSPGSSSLVWWSASMSIAETEADEAPCLGALARRPGCAALAVSTDRLVAELLAAPEASDGSAGCAALLALAPVVASRPSDGSAGCAALLALAPVVASRLLRSLLPSARTACCNTWINVARGRRFRCSN
jgi:hypothetical protein